MTNPKLQWKYTENIDRFRKALREFGELTFSSLREKLGVSEPTLTKYIKSLEAKSEIEAFVKPQNRREKWYRIKPENKERVNTQLAKYEAIQFIEEIPEPIYVHENVRDKGITVEAFASIPREPKKVVEEVLGGIVSGFAMALRTRWLVRKLSKGEKVAIFITMSGDQVERLGVKS